jgi:gamma-glutamylputrescine oxidase
VIVAGNAYLGDKLEPELAKRSMPCGTQVVTTAPLSEEVARSLIPKNYCVEDCNYLLDYYRLTGDNRLLYGGGVVYGARDPDDVERLIMPKLLKTFPQLQGVKIDYRWTGNFLLTLSRMPQFGRLDNNIYYMQGYSGHGVTCTHLAGRLISELLRGDAERFDAFANCRTTRSRAGAACAFRLPPWARPTTACAIGSAFNRPAPAPRRCARRKLLLLK